MSKRVTTEDFILKAQKVHGNKYDYRKAHYIAAKKKILIICPKHGEFFQQPNNHLTGKGCRKCGGNSPLTLDEFIFRASEIHGNKYDYSEVSFKNVESMISIRFKEHGVFKQRLFSHLKGFNCPKCGRVSTTKILKHNEKRFKSDGEKAHGDKYDYSKVKYVNAHKNVTIICPKHNEFSQKPASHIRGVGCPQCGTDSTAAQRLRTTEDYIEEAKTVHGNKYDYSKCIYKGMKYKVEIVCPKHGSFKTQASNHVKSNGSGCPDCAESGFNPTMPGILYYLAVLKDDGKSLYNWNY